MGGDGGTLDANFVIGLDCRVLVFLSSSSNGGGKIGIMIILASSSEIEIGEYMRPGEECKGGGWRGVKWHVLMEGGTRLVDLKIRITF